jgi:hypothetical protein
MAAGLWLQSTFFIIQKMRVIAFFVQSWATNLERIGQVVKKLDI